MNFLQQNCRFGFYSQGRASLCKSFKCGDKDLDDFFTEDAFLQSEELLCKNYCFSLVDDPTQLVAVFTLSNDSIKKIPGSRKKKVEENIPREKIYSSYPAVMIGRLGISQDFQSKHLGSDVLSFIKAYNASDRLRRSRERLSLFRHGGRNDCNAQIFLYFFKNLTDFPTNLI